MKTKGGSGGGGASGSSSNMIGVTVHVWDNFVTCVDLQETQPVFSSLTLCSVVVIILPYRVSE